MTRDRATFWLERVNGTKRLVVVAPSDAPELPRFEGHAEPFKKGYVLKYGVTNAVNAAALRQTLPNLKPVPLGLTTSAGFGDRLGIADTRSRQSIAAGARTSPTS